MNLINNDCDNNEKKDNFYFKVDKLLKNTDPNILKEGKSFSIGCLPLLKNMEYLFLQSQMFNLTSSFDEMEVFFLWGYKYYEWQDYYVDEAFIKKTPTFICENGFLRSVCSWEDEKIFGEYTGGISFLIDTIPYFDSTQPTRLETMLNDASLTLSEDSILRAQKCIDAIIENHLTKYNHQPIIKPNIGRQGAKKVLVVDQAYEDMSVTKGNATEETFKNMLCSAIQENPDADILIKVHPDTFQGTRGGYYTDVRSCGNIYVINQLVNPISLIEYVDKVYVCTSQIGFEALMCKKEVHVFGIPFYSGWGITHDRQLCFRRTQKRSLEEIFFIIYILYTIYVNPQRRSRCEIEDAIDYLIKLRKIYFLEQGLPLEND